MAALGWESTIREKPRARGIGKRYSQDLLDSIRERTPEVLMHYGVENPSKPFRAPWREDRNPGVTYNPRKGHSIWDAGERLDVFKVVGRMEHIEGFAEQVQRAAAILGIALDGDSFTIERPKPRKTPPRFTKPERAGFGHDVSAASFDCFKRLFEPEAEPGREWLRSRGFDAAELAARYGIGWTRRPKGIESAFKLYEPHALGFITIPFFDDATCTTASYMAVRTVPGDVKPNRKEWNPANTPKPLYREWLVGAGLDVLYVVEGLMDCWAMESLSGKPCIGLGSTGMCKRLANLLAYTPEADRPKKVVVALDQDENEAGQRAAKLLMDDLKELRIACGEFKWPQGCDACDVLLARRVEERGDAA